MQLAVGAEDADRGLALAVTAPLGPADHLASRVAQLEAVDQPGHQARPMRQRLTAAIMSSVGTPAARSASMCWVKP